MCVQPQEGRPQNNLVYRQRLGEYGLAVYGRLSSIVGIESGQVLPSKLFAPVGTVCEELRCFWAN